MQIMQEQLPVTLLVMRSYLVLLGASRARFKAPTFGAWTFVIQLRFPGSPRVKSFESTSHSPQIDIPVGRVAD